MGPWARSFLHAVAGNADDPELEVTQLTVEPRRIAAQVDGHEVVLSAAPIPQRIWAAVTRYAQGMGQLEEAAAGRAQSVHLEQLFEEDWEEPLIPRPRSILRDCDADGSDDCEHVVALAFAFAEEIDRDPRRLLRWRGFVSADDAVQDDGADPWHNGRPLPSRTTRDLPVGVVLDRLGTSGLGLQNSDLAKRLVGAYEVLRGDRGSADRRG